MSYAKPAEHRQLQRIRTLSAVYFSDDLAVFNTIGKPTTRTEASDLIRAIDSLALGSTMDDLRNVLGTSSDSNGDTPEPTPEPAPEAKEEPMPEPETQVCERCDKSKPLTEYRKRGAGRQKICKTCYIDPLRGKYQQPLPRDRSRPKKPEPAQPDIVAGMSLTDEIETDGKAWDAWPEVFRNPTLEKLRQIAELLDDTLEGAALFCDRINQLRQEP